MGAEKYSINMSLRTPAVGASAAKGEAISTLVRRLLRFSPSDTFKSHDTKD